MHRESVTLADDALTRESALIIERARIRNSNGVLLNFRELDKPEHFYLVMERERCVLVHERTGSRLILASAICARK